MCAQTRSGFAQPCRPQQQHHQVRSLHRPRQLTRRQTLVPEVLHQRVRRPVVVEERDPYTRTPTTRILTQITTQHRQLRLAALVAATAGRLRRAQRETVARCPSSRSGGAPKRSPAAAMAKRRRRHQAPRRTTKAVFRQPRACSSTIIRRLSISLLPPRAVAEVHCGIATTQRQ